MSHDVRASRSASSIRSRRLRRVQRDSTAAAMQTTAFNIAIGGGAVVGALALEAWGLDTLPGLSALLSAAGLCALLIWTITEARPASSPVSPTSTPMEVADVR